MQCLKLLLPQPPTSLSEKNHLRSPDPKFKFKWLDFHSGSIRKRFTEIIQFQEWKHDVMPPQLQLVIK